MQMQKFAFALLLATCGAAFQLSHTASKKLKVQGLNLSPRCIQTRSSHRFRTK